MTTRQSTTLHMSGDGDDPNNGLAFSTIDAGEEPNRDYDPVLEVWGTIQAPDGQVLTAKMQHAMPDVRDLQSFLNDNFGRGVAQLPESVEHTVKTAISNLLYQGYKITSPNGTEVDGKGLSSYNYDFPETPANLEYYAEQDAAWQPKPGDTVHIVTAQVTGATPRQCAVIYNGVQCLAPEGHAQQHDFGPIAQHQPDVDLFQEQAAAIQRSDDNHTPQDLSDNPRSVQHPDNQAPRLILGPKNAAEQARKRRLKLEIEFDDLAEKYKTDPHNPGVVAALNDAAVALHKREPDNSRVVNFLFDPSSAPAPVAQPEQHQRADLDSLPEAHFAPEPAVTAPNYLIQEASPTNQQYAEAVATLPGVHLQDSVSMTPEQFQQAQADGNPAAIQAAQAFPCPHQSSDHRPCLRPAGHEIELPNRPAVPHVYATTPSMLTQQPATVAPGPNGPHVTYQPPAQPQPDAGFAQPPAPYAAPAQPVQPFQQPHLQAVPDPQSNVAVMSFHEGEPGMPAAPAMPTWQAPQQ